MYKYVLIGNGAYEEYEGCWIFSTFKEAFDFMSNMYNKEYDIWEKDGLEIYSTVNRKIKPEDYLKYTNYEEDNGNLYIEALYYTIHDKCNEYGVYNVGHSWEIYTAKEM